MSAAQPECFSTESTATPMLFTPSMPNSGLILALYTGSVVLTGVKSFGCEKSTAQELPIQSWKRILPSVVCASKSGAVSLIARVITHLRYMRERDGLGIAQQSDTLPFSWSYSSIGFPVRRAVTSVVSCFEAYDGARDAAPRADSAAARAREHVMAAAIVPAHQIGLDGPLTEHHGHRILNVSWPDIAMRADLP